MNSLPAPLPRRALLIGWGAVAIGLLALSAGVHDVAAAKAPWAAGGVVLTVLVSLGWVLADRPVAYEIEPGSLVVRTRLRGRAYRVRAAARQTSPWKDRFAINGGFGFYGWFRCEGRTVRAYVTDPAFRVLVETDEGPVVVSPAAPETVIAALGPSPG